MKNNWPIKKLGEILTPIPSSVKLAKKNMLKTGEFRVIDQSQSFISGYSNDKTDLYQGDLPVIVFGDHALSLKFIDFPFVRGADGTQIIKPEDIVNTKFLFYQLLSNPLANHGYSRHFKYLKELNISIPPLKIQQKIVERLDAIRKAQELNDLQISKTNELFESLIKKEVFDSKFREIPLNEVVLKQEFMDPRKLLEKEFHYVDISSVDRHSRQILFFKRIIGKNAPSRARKIIRDGDTIWSTVRPYLKNIAHVISLPEPKVASTGFCILSPKNEVLDHNWLYYNTSSDWFIQKILPFQKGAAYPAVSDQDILSQTIKLPPLKDQQKIVTKLNAIQDYKKSLLKQKDLLKELFDSVLQKSMNGELDG